MLLARLRSAIRSERRAAAIGPLLVWVAMIGLIEPVAAQDRPAAPAADELLGFSRYLPADTTGYVSLLQGDKVVRAVAESRAWAKVEAVPEVAAALEQARAQLTSEKVPPPARAALDLLAAMFSSEATMAATAESSRQLLNLVRLTALAVPTFAPTQWQPGSPEAQALEEIRGPMRTDWLSAVHDFRMPPLVVAWRLREIERYRPFIDLMIGQGWAAAQREIEKAPPPMQTALSRIYSQTKLGDISAHRLRFRLGDLVPPQEIERGLRGAPLSEAERAVLVGALAGLSIEVHLAYVGDYLTLVVGSDDSVMRQIADRYEGRSQETLAASAGFAALRADIKPNSLLVLYSDGEHAQRELLRIVVPILDQLSDPNFLALLGAPPTVSTLVQNFKLNLVDLAAASPTRQEAVIALDQGLKQIARLEYDAEPPIAGTKPLAAAQFVPAGAVAYSAYRNFSFEGVQRQLTMGLRQSQDELESLKRQYAGRADVEAFVTRRLSVVRELLELFGDKLPPPNGEFGVMFGPFVKLSFSAPWAKQVDQLRFPTMAVAMASPDPDESLVRIVKALPKFAEFGHMFGEPEPPRFEFVARKLDDVAIHGLPDHLQESVRGFEPHFARLGDFVVFSTSHELTKQMRDVQAGKAPSIATAAAYQAKRSLLPETAEQVTFVNGEAVHAELRSAADASFEFLKANREHLKIRESEDALIARAENYLDVALEVVRCFRSAASSVVVEGETHKLHEWIHLEDVAP